MTPQLCTFTQSKALKALGLIIIFLSLYCCLLPAKRPWFHNQKTDLEFECVAAFGFGVFHFMERNKCKKCLKNIQNHRIFCSKECRMSISQVFVENLPNEKWIVIENAPRYMVSTEGRVKSINFKNLGYESLRKISLSKTTKYSTICLSNGGGREKTFLVHRLVAIAFIPNLENKPQVNHINGIKTDNRLENLEWCTNIENCAHSWRIGLTTKHGNQQKGEHHCRRKLSEKDILEIRTSTLQLAALAETYGVTKSTISSVIKGKTWKHI